VGKWNGEMRKWGNEEVGSVMTKSPKHGCITVPQASCVDGAWPDLERPDARQTEIAL